MTLIKVTPEHLETRSKTLDTQINTFNTIYTRIYQEKDDLKLRWAGDANQSYCAQLEGFKNDFAAMEKLFMQYAEYIRTTAAQYRETEQTLAAEAASKLKLV